MQRSTLPVVGPGPRTAQHARIHMSAYKRPQMALRPQVSPYPGGRTSGSKWVKTSGATRSGRGPA
eukprot:CAMPEP_0182610904 /NCGR_PEP_ID=MMETSP1330-20130603/11168_1 /TAXON_ID=464278 /ORGANISM="Picochlorum sp., Strain RCC944" /LENGTH=64 /DNA_ID=CAMNT_0024830215 /DNA_START=89 /DNA_END=280 /DNA_ORIENTATION=+